MVVVEAEGWGMGVMGGREDGEGGWMWWGEWMLGGLLGLDSFVLRSELSATIRICQDAVNSGHSIRAAARDPSGEYSRCAGDQ